MKTKKTKTKMGSSHAIFYAPFAPATNPALISGGFIFISFLQILIYSFFL